MELNTRRNIQIEPNDSFRQFKLVVLGESVGKTALIMRFEQNRFKKNSDPTIGGNFVKKTVQIERNMIELQIWDTAGTKVMQSLLQVYYRTANAAIVVYDIQRYDSYNYAKTLMKRVKQNAVLDIVIALVGNQIDLGNNREVSFEEAENYAEENGLLFMETSAKTGTNVEDLFLTVSKRLLNGKQDKAQVVEFTEKITIKNSNKCMI